MKIKYNEEIGEYDGKYLNFREASEELWMIINNEEELLGHIEKIRVGAWMTFCLTLEQDCYLSPSCMDEAREVIKRLNAKRYAVSEGGSK